MVHKNPGLTGTGEVSTLRPWSFASGNSSVVEHRLAKARVEGSNPFSRSNIFPDNPSPALKFRFVLVRRWDRDLGLAWAQSFTEAFSLVPVGDGGGLPHASSPRE